MLFMFVVFHPKPSTLLEYITNNTIYLLFEDVKRFIGETITAQTPVLLLYWTYTLKKKRVQ